MEKLTKRELQMMKIFWEGEKPLTTVDIFHEQKENGWAKNYIQNTVAKLLKKGFITECGLVRSNTQYARQFIPKISREEYSAGLLSDLKVSPYKFSRMMIHMVKENNEIDKERLIMELEETLHQLREMK